MFKSTLYVWIWYIYIEYLYIWIFQNGWSYLIIVGYRRWYPISLNRRFLYGRIRLCDSSQKCRRVVRQSSSADGLFTTSGSPDTVRFLGWTCCCLSSTCRAGESCSIALAGITHSCWEFLHDTFSCTFETYYGLKRFLLSLRN